MCIKRQKAMNNEHGIRLKHFHYHGVDKIYVRVHLMNSI